MVISMLLFLLLIFLLLRRLFLLTLLLYTFSFCIAIVTGSEANSGKSRNGLIAGLRNNTDSITPSSALTPYAPNPIRP